MTRRGGKGAEDDGPAGLQADAGEEEFGADGGEGLLDEIELAHGDAAGEEDEVAGASEGEGTGEIGYAVADDGEADGVAAGFEHKGGEGVAVGVADLVRLGSLVELD